MSTVKLGERRVKSGGYFIDGIKVIEGRPVIFLTAWIDRHLKIYTVQWVRYSAPLLDTCEAINLIVADLEKTTKIRTGGAVR